VVSDGCERWTTKFPALGGLGLGGMTAVWMVAEVYLQANYKYFTCT